MATLPRQPNDPHPGPRVPPWLISVVLHLVLVIVMGLTFRGVSRGIQAAEEPGRDVGIVLKHASESGEERYEDESDQQAEETAETQELAEPVEAALAALPAEAEASAAQEALPQLPVIGPGDLAGGEGMVGAGTLTGGAQQPRRVTGGKAGVRLYGGPEAVGSKFVFVFDRSTSMVGAPLASAKRELLQGLTNLESTHQFQIIFFNHQLRVFDLSGGQNRIPFATSHAKEMAARFVGGITADGGTDRFTALMSAVALQPDVIFFLTDSDDPMTGSELERIRRRNRGIASFHCIEFGFGPASGGENFLHRLARQNTGSYIYVDTTQLRP